MLFGAVEAQWVLSVMDEAANKLSLTSYLTPDILKDKVIDSVDQEMVVALKEHFEVERQYMEVLQQYLQQVGIFFDQQKHETRLAWYRLR